MRQPARRAKTWLLWLGILCVAASAGGCKFLADEFYYVDVVPPRQRPVEGEPTPLGFESAR